MVFRSQFTFTTIWLEIYRKQLLPQQFQLQSGNSLAERQNEQKTMRNIEHKCYISVHLCYFSIPEHLI